MNVIRVNQQHIYVALPAHIEAVNLHGHVSNSAR